MKKSNKKLVFAWVNLSIPVNQLQAALDEYESRSYGCDTYKDGLARFTIDGSSVVKYNLYDRHES